MKKHLLNTGVNLLEMMKRIKPKKGQESVWDYPRPPRIELFTGTLEIIFNGESIAKTNRAFRVLETSHPPSYYLPVDSFKSDVIIPAEGSSHCEWKGRAQYYSIQYNGRIAERAAWTYPDPTPAFQGIQDHISVYAHQMDACYVNGEKVEAQAGDFYGGWITSNILGPFKGAPGTWGW